MRKKHKVKTRVVDNKVVTKVVTYIMLDEDGEALRKADFPFPNGIRTIETKVLLDLDCLEDALF